MFSGAIHVHSKYSDGEFTLSELRSKLLAHNCRFAIVTDHAEAFDETKLCRYEQEIHTLTDGDFIFIPGLEFECERRMHVLCLDALPRACNGNAQEVISRIQEKRGIAVIAHPPDMAFEYIEQFEILPDGIETWNSKYDGQVAPRPQTFALLQRLRHRSPEMKAFYGQDLHWKTQYCRLFTQVECQQLTRVDIISALRQGNYVGLNKGICLPSDGLISRARSESFTRLHGRSQRFRRMTARTNKLLARFGITMPLPIKAQFRRLL